MSDLAKNKSEAPQVGDIWHRVDGSKSYQGMELDWKTYRVTKVTPRGAWFMPEKHHYVQPKLRFALTSGARWISRTKEEALQRLIARKRRHLAILSSEQQAAEDTMAAAKEAAAAMGVKV